jgi:hypothetical protein
MSPDTLSFIVHRLYPYLSPLDQLNLVRAEISCTMTMQYHLTEFFDKVAGLSWRTIHTFLISTHGRIGGEFVGLLFSPSWYPLYGALEIYFELQFDEQFADIRHAFHDTFSLPYHHYYSREWCFQHGPCMEIYIRNNFGSHDSDKTWYPVRLFSKIPKPSCTADSNYITHDKAICTYYHYAKNRQMVPLTKNNSLLFYLHHKYQHLSLIQRIRNWIYYREQIPTDIVVVPFISSTGTNNNIFDLKTS